MSEDKNEILGGVLELLDALRTEAGNLISEKWRPVLDAVRVDAIIEYLEQSAIACTERIGAINDIIDRTTKIHTQMSAERDAVALKRQTFVQALYQLNSVRASGLMDRINEMEEAQVQKDKGEFANMAVWEAAKIVLERVGREMTTREIVEALRKGGKNFDKGKATSAVSAALRTGKAAGVFTPLKISGKRLRWTLAKSKEAESLFEE